MRHLVAFAILVCVGLYAPHTLGYPNTLLLASQNAEGGGEGEGATDYTSDSRMKGCWFFEDSAAGEVPDSCAGGSDQDLTEQGAPNYTDSEVPTNAPVGTESFIGNNADYLEVADHDDFGVANSTVTVGCWYSHLGDGSIFDKRNAGTSGFEFAVSSEGVLILRTTDFGDVETASTGLANSTWYHLVAQVDNTDGSNDDLEIYVNGELDCDGGCATVDANLADATDLGVGATASGTNPVGLGPSNLAHLYECWFAEGSDDLSAAEICEICRFGLDGNTTDRGATCGSCSLP